MPNFRSLVIRLMALVCLTLATPCFAQNEDPAPAPTTQQATPASAQQAEVPKTDFLNDTLETFNGWVYTALFFSITGDAFDIPLVDADGNPVLDDKGKPQVNAVPFPFILFVLVAGGVFFTFFYSFIGIRGIRHAVEIVRGKYDSEGDEGDVSHFRALTSALSATVGLGNIAGVAIAIQIGGPGAMLWMIIAAFFGMSLKFNSCTLAQMYRRKNPDGSVSGGPMFYLDMGIRALADGRFTGIAKAFGVIYALMIIGGSFGGGNMFQANQSFGAINATFELSGWMAHAFGIGLAVMVALVIIGGIQRIGAATSRIVPLMVGIYVIASLFIIFTNISAIPETIATICKMAFTDNAMYGGMVGVLVKGFQRASFSNEAGIGSAAVAHAAAKTDEPVREGLVAMLEPVVDTMLVCTMTAMVVVITGVWNDPALLEAGGDLKGVQLTAAAFATEIWWFPYILTICVLLFAYSTMISWAYYGERGWIYLVDHLGEGMGQRTLVVYRLLFVFFVYIGSIAKLQHVLDFSDLMILCMALPNVVGGALLAPTVRAALNNYWKRFLAGAFDEAPAAKAK